MVTGSKRAAVAHKKILAACRRKSNGILQLAMLLYTVMHKDLFVVRGHRSFGDYVDQELPIGQSTARAYVRVFEYVRYLSGIGKMKIKRISDFGYSRLAVLMMLPRHTVKIHTDMLNKAMREKWSLQQLKCAVQTVNGVVPGSSAMLTGLHFSGDISPVDSAGAHRYTRIIGIHEGVNDSTAVYRAVMNYAAMIVPPPASAANPSPVRPSPVRPSPARPSSVRRKARRKALALRLTPSINGLGQRP